jgi:hypothetical protein
MADTSHLCSALPPPPGSKVVVGRGEKVLRMLQEWQVLALRHDTQFCGLCAEVRWDGQVS